MSIKIKDLVKNLQNKDQKAEVEFVVIDDKGDIVCMDIKRRASSLVRILKMFGRAE